MPTKSSGAEFKQFYSDQKFWPEKSYHEGEQILVDGVLATSETEFSEISDQAQITVSGGRVLGLPRYSCGDGPTFEARFKAWRRSRGMQVLVAEIPGDRVEEARRAIQAVGGRVTN